MVYGYFLLLILGQFIIPCCSYNANCPKFNWTHESPEFRECLTEMFTTKFSANLDHHLFPSDGDSLNYNDWDTKEERESLRNQSRKGFSPTWEVSVVSQKGFLKCFRMNQLESLFSLFSNHPSLSSQFDLLSEHERISTVISNIFPGPAIHTPSAIFNELEQERPNEIIVKENAELLFAYAQCHLEKVLYTAAPYYGNTAPSPDLLRLMVLHKVCNNRAYSFCPDPCSSNPCGRLNGVAGVSNELVCSRTNGGILETDYKCRCLENYRWSYEMRQCVVKQCDQWHSKDGCVLANTAHCSLNASHGDQLSCECKPGFGGDRCEQRLDICKGRKARDDCALANNGSCRAIGDALFVCTCPKYYWLPALRIDNESSRSCVHYSDCSTPCGPYGICSRNLDYRNSSEERCLCFEGFTKKNMTHLTSKCDIPKPEWGSWSAWSACDVPCGSHAWKTRTRICRVCCRDVLMLLEFFSCSQSKDIAYYEYYLEEIGDKNYTVRSTSCLWNESCPCATLSPPIGGVVQLGPVDVDRCDERPCDRIWDHWTQWSTCSSERYVSRAHNCSYSIRCRRRKCLMEHSSPFGKACDTRYEFVDCEPCSLENTSCDNPATFYRLKAWHSKEMHVKEIRRMWNSSWSDWSECINCSRIRHRRCASDACGGAGRVFVQVAIGGWLARASDFNEDVFKPCQCLNEDLASRVGTRVFESLNAMCADVALKFGRSAWAPWSPWSACSYSEQLNSGSEWDSLQSFNTSGRPGDAWDKRLLCVRRRTCVTGNCSGGGLQKALCAGHICTGFRDEQRDLRAFLNTSALSAFQNSIILLLIRETDGTSDFLSIVLLIFVLGSTIGSLFYQLFYGYRKQFPVDEITGSGVPSENFRMKRKRSASASSSARRQSDSVERLCLRHRVRQQRQATGHRARSLTRRSYVMVHVRSSNSDTGSTRTEELSLRKVAPCDSHSLSPRDARSQREDESERKSVASESLSEGSLSEAPYVHSSGSPVRSGVGSESNSGSGVGPGSEPAEFTSSSVLNVDPPLNPAIADATFRGFRPESVGWPLAAPGHTAAFALQDPLSNAQQQFPNSAGPVPAVPLPFGSPVLLRPQASPNADADDEL